MNHDNESVARQVKVHIAIAVVVLALVGVALIIQGADLDRSQAMKLIMAITAVEVFLVVLFLMHLLREDHSVTNLAILTLFLVSALCLLANATFHDSYGQHPEKIELTSSHDEEEE